jgi:type II secretory pathway predicted ATPase ExeA
MNEEYIKYWGLDQHPFLMAPDGNMMCVTGQYFECFERLRYAIDTNKGGVLIASEDAGLGKTTILLKLIDELKEEYGINFRYSYIDHPTLTASQVVEQITGSITGEVPSDNKLKNLIRLKEVLIETKREGGRSIIVVDEGQMLCEARDVLQELRALINLTHSNEHLHTFIFSGQKALWDTLQTIPEFWQRLPVRYYFTPLRFKETRELIRYRLNKAGLDVAREIFTEEALEIIHKHSHGLPRSIIALSDLALLNGFNDRTRKIGFKEVSKAINAMGGKGDTLFYLTQERNEETKDAIATETTIPSQKPANTLEYITQNFKKSLSSRSLNTYIKPAIVVAIIIFFIFLGALGQRIFSSGGQKDTVLTASKEPEKTTIGEPTSQASERKNQPETAPENKDDSTNTLTVNESDEEKTKEILDAFKKAEVQPELTRTAIVSVEGANVRGAPYLEAQRILSITKGEMLTVTDERTDRTGMKWYKVLLNNNREGWIADKVVAITLIKQKDF